MKPLVTQERVQELLRYAPTTGRFRWRKSKGSARAGVEATNWSSAGYARVQIDGRRYCLHRLAWLYVYGQHPNGQIDHKNRNRADNRIANLREGRPDKNMGNIDPRSATGFKGVRRFGCGSFGAHTG